MLFSRPRIRIKRFKFLIRIPDPDPGFTDAAIRSKQHIELYELNAVKVEKFTLHIEGKKFWFVSCTV